MKRMSRASAYPDVSHVSIRTTTQAGMNIDGGREESPRKHRHFNLNLRAGKLRQQCGCSCRQVPDRIMMPVPLALWLT
jgi:hypothetical protein